MKKINGGGKLPVFFDIVTLIDSFLWHILALFVDICMFVIYQPPILDKIKQNINKTLTKTNRLKIAKVVWKKIQGDKIIKEKVLFLSNSNY